MNMKVEEKIKSYIGLTCILVVYSVLVISLIYFIFDLDKVMFTAIIAFIGAIIGGLVSGLLTLNGVKLTLRQQQAEKLEEKYSIYNLIFSELLHRNIKLQSNIKSLNSKRYQQVIQEVYDSAKDLAEVSKQFISEASRINPKTLSVIKSTIWVAEDILGYIDYAYDNDYEENIIMHTLMTDYYFRVTKNDIELEECGRDLKKKLTEYEVI
jgi:NADH:ubiquinone oxidoreductase subunit 6 (subunit J)